MKIIEKLSTYAALIGVVGAIGGGFYTWGQFNTRLDAIEATPAVDLSPLVAYIQTDPVTVHRQELEELAIQKAGIMLELKLLRGK